MLIFTYMGNLGTCLVFKVSISAFVNSYSLFLILDFSPNLLLSMLWLVPIWETLGDSPLIILYIPVIIPPIFLQKSRVYTV